MKKIIATMLLITACGSTPSNTDTAPERDPISTESPSENQAEPTLPEPPPEPITEVTRTQLDDILSQGPAHILAMVQTDSVIEGGKFVGFKIVSFRTEAPSILGVQTDDIVTKVNGLPIERPEQFLKIFEQLKTAVEIQFTILRNGKTMTLSAPIQ